jgi:hypothetical protein
MSSLRMYLPVGNASAAHTESKTTYTIQSGEKCQPVRGFHTSHGGLELISHPIGTTLCRDNMYLIYTVHSDSKKG